MREREDLNRLRTTEYFKNMKHGQLSIMETMRRKVQRRSHGTARSHISYLIEYFVYSKQKPIEAKLNLDLDSYLVQIHSSIHYRVNAPFLLIDFLSNENIFLIKILSFPLTRKRVETLSEGARGDGKCFFCHVLFISGFLFERNTF